MNTSAKKIIKLAVLVTFFVLIIVYAFFRSYDLIFGIKIKDVSIADGKTYTESPIVLTGIAKNAVNLSLNGREISIDDKGNFQEAVALYKGYNIVTIRAMDKFGSVDEENYKLMYKGQE